MNNALGKELAYDKFTTAPKQIQKTEHERLPSIMLIS